MSVIRINTFGGIFPALEDRALPSVGATQAENLVPRTAEFRPSLGSTTYAGALGTSGPRTIYRLQRDSSGALNTNPASGWKAYANWTTLAKWPQNDNNTERTTVTDGAGSYAPRVIDATGQDRQLGVPPPAKPTLVINSGDYFTDDDRSSAIQAAFASVATALKTGLARAKVGATYTNNLTQGYLETGAEVADPVVQYRSRVYRYTAFEGTLTEAYTSVAEADVEWVRSTGLGEWMQAGATPAWMGGAGTEHYRILYNAYGQGYKFTRATAQTALQALKLPDGTTALLSATQVTELLDKCAALFDPNGQYANPTVEPLRTSVTKLEAALDTRPQGSYSSTQTSTEQDNAVTAAANAIFDALSRNGLTLFQSFGGA